MQADVLRLVASTLALWLRGRLPPSGQPALHDFEARCLVLIDALPDGAGPAVPAADTLDQPGLRLALEWLFASLLSAHAGDPWAGLAAHSVRLLALADLPGLLGMILQPPRPPGVRP